MKDKNSYLLLFRICFGISKRKQRGEMLKRVQHDMVLVFLFLTVVSCFVFPVYASFGEDVNNLLDRFFGNKQPVQKVITSEDVHIPEIVLPENPTMEDVIEFRQKVETEEKELADFTERLDESRASLWKTEEERTSVASQLQALDQELGFSSQKLEKLRYKNLNGKKI